MTSKLLLIALLAYTLMCTILYIHLYTDVQYIKQLTAQHTLDLVRFRWLRYI